jgi:hypothetical protein
LDPESSVNRRNVPATCGQCHAGVVRIFEESIHGALAKAGNAKAPVCNHCHTSHQIRRVEMESWKLDIIQECGNCHQESLRTYRDTFHGQVTALGFTRVARCSDCHGAHDILPRSDPRSSVAPDRIVATCRKCHATANASFVRYDPHADTENRVRNPLLFYAARFMRLLVAGVFVFFGLHTVLWFGRALIAKRRGAGERANGEEKKDG